MKNTRESAGVIGLLAAIIVGPFLIKLIIASVLGAFVWWGFGVNWLIATLITWLVLTIISEIGDLFYGFKSKTPCPHCGKPLRTPGAQQCRHCGEKWHGKSL